MVSKSPKLPPEVPSDVVAVPATRRAHVHLIAVDGRWVMRLGRRTEKTFDKRYDAFMAAIPFAREHNARLFVHYPSGEIREGGTTECEELMLKMWKMVYEDHNGPMD
jgi:hypothetical protein